MHYAEHVLPRGPIERIWFARADAGHRDTILPDGSFELIFHLGDAVLQDGVAQPMAMLVGETRRPTTIEPAGRIDCVGVRLRHGYAAGVVGAPLTEVRDRMFDLRDVWGARAARLRDSLGALERDDARVALLVDSIHGDGEELSDAAARAILRTGGRVSVSRLASFCGVHVRTLTRAFVRSIGVTPKTLCRLIRLQKAAALLRAGEPAAGVAIDTGFTDQSHLINEFRALAGFSPSKYVELPPGLSAHLLSDFSNRIEPAAR
ncbi:MAG TPA: AraC family transcriptional regulator [Thermoanaerobaculia bacterium]